MVVQGDLFRLKWGVGASLVDTALTRLEIKNCKRLIFNHLQFVGVPRTGVEPARLAALAPETSASTIPPPGLLLCKGRDFFLFLQVVGRFFLFLQLESTGVYGGIYRILLGDLTGEICREGRVRRRFVRLGWR